MDRSWAEQTAEDIATEPSMPGLTELSSVLDASDAEVAAGQSVPAEPVLTRMRRIAEQVRLRRADGAIPSV